MFQDSASPMHATPPVYQTASMMKRRDSYSAEVSRHSQPAGDQRSEQVNGLWS